MLRRTMFLSGLALMMAAASAAQAQERQPRFQGFGGPGGFPGMDVFLLQAQEVQKELGISDEQRGLIGDMMEDIQNQIQGFRNRAGGGAGNSQNLSEEERRKMFEEGRKRMEELGKKSDEMVAMVLDKKQVERFGELRLQSAGVQAFNRPDVAEKLKLTDEQKDKMRKIREDAPRPDFRALFNQNASEEERNEARTKMREQMEKTANDILNVLTAEQKETWAKMQGKKFDFPQPAGFGGFGGRRPGGEGQPPPRRRPDTKKDDK